MAKSPPHPYAGIENASPPIQKTAKYRSHLAIRLGQRQWFLVCLIQTQRPGGKVWSGMVHDA
jgi:hypothetical protein